MGLGIGFLDSVDKGLAKFKVSLFEDDESSRSGLRTLLLTRFRRE